jgi:hypothetical protein
VGVSGPPWNTVICTLFTDRATDGRGEVIYENEGVLVDRRLGEQTTVSPAVTADT